jgi:hypothetical protein
MRCRVDKVIHGVSHVDRIPRRAVPPVHSFALACNTCVSFLVCQV